MAVVKKITNLTTHNCNTCHEPIGIGKLAVKKRQKPPLENEWHHPDCWKGVRI